MSKRKMTNNDQKKNDKQSAKEKGQTMTKRKMTNNEQKKNDNFSFGHCLSFFFWSLFVIFLLVIVCHFSFGHCLSFFFWSLFVIFLLVMKNDKQ
jgi:succinate-acetate transporter protein